MTWLDLASKKAAITKLTNAKRLNGSTSCGAQRKNKLRSSHPVLYFHLLCLINRLAVPRCQRRQRSEYTEHHGKRWQRLSREWKEKRGNRSCMFNERAGRGAERETWHLCVHVYMRTYVRCVCAWETNKGWNIIPLQHELIQHKRNTLMRRKELTASQACQCGCV